MGRNLSPGEQLMQELRVIPKLIQSLRHDIEKTRSSVLTSPQWSDMKVQGGLRLSQEEKNVTIIDLTDYNVKQIESLLERKKEILDLVMTMPDMLQRHVLITTYAHCQTFEEAMDRLEMTRNNYFMLKRKGLESLNLILKNTKSVQIDTK